MLCKTYDRKILIAGIGLFIDYDFYWRIYVKMFAA